MKKTLETTIRVPRGRPAFTQGTVRNTVRGKLMKHKCGGWQYFRVKSDTWRCRRCGTITGTLKYRPLKKE